MLYTNPSRDSIVPSYVEALGFMLPLHFSLSRCSYFPTPFKTLNLRVPIPLNQCVTNTFMLSRSECLCCPRGFLSNEHSQMSYSWYPMYRGTWNPFLLWGHIPKWIELLKEKVKMGIHEPSNAPYSNRWFMVLKKKGTIRFIQDSNQ